MKHLLDGDGLGAKAGNNGAKLTGDMHQPMFKRIVGLRSNYAGRNKSVGASVGVDYSIAGLLRSAIYSDNPHFRFAAAVSPRAGGAKKRALREHFLLIELVVPVYALNV